MLDQQEAVDSAGPDPHEIRAHMIEVPDETSGSEQLLDDLTADDSWAKPKKRTNKRLTYLTITLALALFGIGTFIAGAKIAGGSSSSSGGANARNGAFAGLGGTGGLPAGLGGAGGFGGLAGGGGGRRNRTASASSNATAAGSAALSDLINGTSSSATEPAISGKVTAVDATSITVTKSDGTTAVITLDNNSTLARRTNTSVTGIKIGDAIAAEGVADTAGNVAATAVTVGDLPASATASTEPAPETDGNLGGLLGG